MLSKDAIKGKKIINCHSGIIPISRGLDAFKWAIYYERPLGVTLHYIDEEADKGRIISIRRTNVYITDSLETLARRHYENEIDMLSDFDKFLGNSVFDVDYKKLDETEPTRRMPIDIEMQMARKFEEYKEKQNKIFYKMG